MTEEETATTAEDVDAPQATEEAAEVETEVEAEAPTEDDSDAPSDNAEEDKPDPRQRKIAELSFKERELKRQNAKLMHMLEQSTKAQAKAQAPQAPKIEDFETIEEFLDARDTYRDAQREQPKAEPADDYDLTDFEISRDDLYANGMAKHEDFADVVGAENVNITLPMANAIVEIDDSDLQVDTAYYLGNNPKEAARIAKLSPVRQIAEVEKLGIKISSKKQPQGKQVSKAPEPIKPVGGSKTTSDEIQPTEDFESFMKKRNKQLGRG